jgi:NAD(P)-dependent dehydrogenase (short-subunit alcohol dehydrogenase family)
MSSTLHAALVTGGAGRGIGHGISEALAAAGWAVVIVDQDVQEAQRLAEALRSRGAQIEVVCGDITDRDCARRGVAASVKSFGGLHGLVNSAGIGLVKPVGEISDAEAERLLDVNFLAAFRFSRAALPELQKSRGAIVNVGSIHAHGAAQKYALYAASKCALEGLTRGVAVDYGDRGVRANIVHPGLVESPQNAALFAAFTPDPVKWSREYTSQRQCSSHLTTAREVGELVEFLLSTRSAAITGQAIQIDGGTSALLWNREQGP